MKRLISGAAALLLAAVFCVPAPAASLCDSIPADTAARSGARSEWLQNFEEVEVSAAVDIRFVRVPDTEAPRIVYDTKGSYTTRFRAEVREGTLHIFERVDARRPERTTVTVYYNELRALKLLDAAAVVEGVLESSMFDLTVGARSTFAAKLAVQDLRMDLSGRSSTAILSGEVRYLTLTASTGEVKAAELEAMAARIEASNNAAVTLTVTERLEAATSTGATIDYKGQPSIIRAGARFLGGGVGRVE